MIRPWIDDFGVKKSSRYLFLVVNVASNNHVFLKSAICHRPGSAIAIMEFLSVREVHLTREDVRSRSDPPDKVMAWASSAKSLRFTSLLSGETRYQKIGREQ